MRMEADDVTPNCVSAREDVSATPSLIETFFPVQKVSAEAQKERKSGGGQTLTSFGSYWKGRKPLVLSRACVLASLLPTTGDAEKDLELFEALMGMDDAAMEIRRRSALSVSDVLRYGTDEEKEELVGIADPSGANKPKFRKIATGRKAELHSAIFRRMPFAERVARSDRAEDVAEADLLGSRVWNLASARLGTVAQDMPSFVEEIGKMRFGHKPRVMDVFSGGGSIPFAAARAGCVSLASDLNPIACMLTWGALRMASLSTKARKDFVATQKRVASDVRDELDRLFVETNLAGERAKAYLYCLEAKCPHTGWMVPLSTSWIVSGSRSICARLIPDHAAKRFGIEIIQGASPEEMDRARNGTVRKGIMTYDLDGQTYEVPIRLLRGDFKKSDGSLGNRLRPWEKHDFEPRPGDVFQERLYCIQWACQEWDETHQRMETWTEFRGPSDEDLKREQVVSAAVSASLSTWQDQGLVPDLAIEPGDKTSEPIRTRGWTHWHHLFPPRHLLVLALTRSAINKVKDEETRALCLIAFCRLLNISSKLCLYNPTGGNVGRDPKVDHVFTNQALNVFFNYGVRASSYLFGSSLLDPEDFPEFEAEISVFNAPAYDGARAADIFITDPPYADAINYHEITEYFISWMRKSLPAPFRDWVWDSRRSLAVKGDGDDFKREMIRAYKAMADHMPDNGIQVIMFTHQSGSVWADMASIMWASGLRVTAAWYISTETSSELKKGGYVQGTVLLVVRKRLEDVRAYEDEIAIDLRNETKRQIETLTGLNQKVKSRSQVEENLFEDPDLQMAGYAAALRVLTGYRWIGGTDMAQEALRPRAKDETTVVDRYIEMAVGIATEYLIPDGVSPRTWGRLAPEERFYLKMLEMEAEGLKKLDNYQNFAKAYRVPDFQELMASMSPNSARLKTATEMKRALFDGRFGKSMTRAVLYAVRDLAAGADGKDVMHGLKDAMDDYMARKRDNDLIEVVQYLARRTDKIRPDEARAARVLAELVYNDHL